ncbi:MAG: hydroxyglutarate oxidase [Bellilinea sp.]|nr:MAG: hydroxyglutarate oxidase [Bellilinea sp.]
MTDRTFDIAIIGGGIVGMATALALSKQTSASIAVLEAEKKLAAHQTGNNSGVIHSGIYYKPGSLKARNCVEGRQALYQFCQEHNIRHENCGKVIVATTPDELPRLDALFERGQANGLTGLRRLTPAEIKEYEPHATGLAGIYVPQTGIVDYVQVVEKYAEIFQLEGGQIFTNSTFQSLTSKGDELVLNTTNGEFRTRYLINCGGLYSDRIAKKCGVNPGLQIIPFRGEYYDIVPQKHYLVRNLIYPVPDPRFPFLGVHFTRRVTGGIEAGPNAVLAFKREGYKLSDISITDILTYATFIGFWRMGLKYWRMGFEEFYRSLSKRAFVSALQKLIPDLGMNDVHRSGAGVRAQALEPNGALVDDFRIVEAAGMIHVLNAPSPAATASLSIGKTIASMAIRNFNLREKQPASQTSG